MGCTGLMATMDIGGLSTNGCVMRGQRYGAPIGIPPLLERAILENDRSNRKQITGGVVLINPGAALGSGGIDHELRHVYGVIDGHGGLYLGHGG